MVFSYFKFSSLSNTSNIETTTKTVFAKSIPTETVAGIISNNQDLTDFKKYIKTTAQFGSLDNTEPFTVFAFTNNAFKSADSEAKAIFADNSKTEIQKNILSYHIVNGNIKTDAMTEGQKLKTLQGSEIVVKVEDKDIFIVDMKGNKAHVEKAGIPAKNGSVYIIDGVLLPQ